MAKSKKSVEVINKGSFGGAYFLTFIGAAVYFVQRVDGFWNIVAALLKACVWPAFVIHRVLELLNI
jgi:hypothetical protein